MAPWQNPSIRPVSIIIRLPLITMRRRIIIIKLPFSEHKEAKDYAEAAHEHSEQGHKHTATAREHSKK
jgi:hypothetical protein